MFKKFILLFVFLSSALLYAQESKASDKGKNAIALSFLGGYQGIQNDTWHNAGYGGLEIGYVRQLSSAGFFGLGLETKFGAGDLGQGNFLSSFAIKADRTWLLYGAWVLGFGLRFDINLANALYSVQGKYNFTPFLRNAFSTRIDSKTDFLVGIDLGMPINVDVNNSKMGIKGVDVRLFVSFLGEI